MTKDDSRALYGAAILLMVIHHIFGTNVLVEAGYMTFLPQDDVTRLGWLCKICVAMYAFLSGYGLEKQYRDSGYVKFLLPKIKSFILLYWGTLAVNYLIGIPAGYYAKYSIGELAAAVFGKTTIAGPAHWYVTEYLFLLLLFPAFHQLLQRLSLKRLAALIAAACAVMTIAALVSQTARNLLWKGSGLMRIVCVVVFFEAMVCARYGIFERFLTSRHALYFAAALILLCVITRMQTSTGSRYSRIDMLIIVPYMLGMTAVIRAIPAIIRKVLSFYGGLSRYIWLLHVTIIYIVQRYINPPEISLVILITNLAAVTLAAFAAKKGGEALQRRLIHRRRTS